MLALPGARGCGLEFVVSGTRECEAGQGGNHTKHVSWPAVLAKEIPILHCLPETDEKLRPPFNTGHFITRARLQPLGELLHRQLTQSILIHLVLVVGAREEALS